MAKQRLGDGSLSNQLNYMSNMLLLIGLNIFDGKWMTGWNIIRDVLLLALNGLMFLFIQRSYDLLLLPNPGNSILNSFLPILYLFNTLAHIIQICWIIYFRKDLLDFVDLAHSEVERQKTDEEKEAYNNSMSFNKMISVVAIALSILAHLVVLYNLTLNRSGLQGPAVMFMDLEKLNESPNYEIIIATTIISSAMIILARCGFLMIFITLLGHCSSQYRVLGVRIKNIVHKMSNLDIIDHKSIMDDLKLTIDCHCLIISMISKLNNIYKITLAAIFITVMVFTVVSLLLREPMLLWILVTQMFSIFIFTFVSENLNTERDHFFHSVYSADWYLASVNNRKYICFIMLMASKPLNLTIAKLKALSLETFFSFIKFAYSTYTLVKFKSED